LRHAFTHCPAGVDWQDMPIRLVSDAPDALVIVEVGDDKRKLA
jgi:hypothetical protein